jgi:hypothetical protein
MLGLPFVLRRWDDAGFPVDERVFLRSRRRGDRGEKMRRLMKLYRKLSVSQTSNAARVARLMQQALAGGVEMGEERLADIDRQQSEATEAAQSAAEEQLALAEEIVEMSLEENYGEQTVAILDRLTDAELHAAVATIEMGAMPRDFFRYRDIPPSGNSTKPSGNEQAAPSSPPDTPAGS